MYFSSNMFPLFSVSHFNNMQEIIADKEYVEILDLWLVAPPLEKKTQ